MHGWGGPFCVVPAYKRHNIDISLEHWRCFDSGPMKGRNDRLHKRHTYTPLVKKIIRTKLRHARLLWRYLWEQWQWSNVV